MSNMIIMQHVACTRSIVYVALLGCFVIVLQIIRSKELKTAGFYMRTMNFILAIDLCLCKKQGGSAGSMMGILPSLRAKMSESFCGNM